MSLLTVFLSWWGEAALFLVRFPNPLALGCESENLATFFLVPPFLDNELLWPESSFKSIRAYIWFQLFRYIYKKSLLHLLWNCSRILLWIVLLLCFPKCSSSVCRSFRPKCLFCQRHELAQKNKTEVKQILEIHLHLYCKLLVENVTWSV